MTHRGTVLACSKTGTPGRFFVTYQMNGKKGFYAYSDRVLPEGREITVEGGQVVA